MTIGVSKRVPCSSLSGRCAEHGAWRPEESRACEGSCAETRQLSWSDYLDRKGWKRTSLWGWGIRELVILPEIHTKITMVLCSERMGSYPDFLFYTHIPGRHGWGPRSASPLLGNIQECFVLSNQALRKHTGWTKNIQSEFNALQSIMFVHVPSSYLFNGFMCFELLRQSGIGKTNYPSDQGAEGHCWDSSPLWDHSLRLHRPLLAPCIWSLFVL